MYIPTRKSTTPSRGNAFSRWLGRSILKLMGWRFEGELPETGKCVVIVAPHTSNWDFVVGMAAMLAIGVRASWMGKHQIFFWPVKYLWRWLGGIPTIRHQHLGAVEQRVQLIQNSQQIFLALAPEGTRSKVHQWKSGFYYIALGACVPILPVYFNYARKVIGLADAFIPTGDATRDIEKLREFYRQHPGKRPELAG